MWWWFSFKGVGYLAVLLGMVCVAVGEGLAAALADTGESSGPYYAGTLFLGAAFLWVLGRKLHEPKADGSSAGDHSCLSIRLEWWSIGYVALGVVFLLRG